MTVPDFEEGGRIIMIIKAPRGQLILFEYKDEYGRWIAEGAITAFMEAHKYD